MASILSLLLSCSLHLDDALLVGVVDAFSAGNAFAVVDTAGMDDESDDLAPGSSSEARAAIERILARGGDPVVGILPLRPAWIADLERPPEALFDACQQVEIATAKLSEFDYQCRYLGATPRARARRECTLEAYGASLELPALGRFVMVSLAHAPSPLAEPQPDAPGASNIHPAGGIFFPGAVR